MREVSTLRFVGKWHPLLRKRQDLLLRAIPGATGDVTMKRQRMLKIKNSRRVPIRPATAIVCESSRVPAARNTPRFLSPLASPDIRCRSRDAHCVLVTAIGCWVASPNPRIFFVDISSADQYNKSVSSESVSILVCFCASQAAETPIGR